MIGNDLMSLFYAPDICGSNISNAPIYFQESNLHLLRRDLIRSVFRSVGLSTEYEIRNPVSHGITRLDIDKHDNNLLLAGSTNGNILLYNFANNSTKDGALTPMRWKSCHRGVISCVQWYHNDNGACVTTAFDGRVLVWDTSMFEVAAEFDLSDKVYCAAMRTDGANNLVAIGTGAKSVRLCNLNSGDLSHTLPHSSAVFCLDWSPQGGHILATGCMDGSAKVWDIRKSGHGPLLSLDWQQDHAVAARGFSGGGLNSLEFQRRDMTRDMVSRAHTSSVLSVKYSSCGNFLVTAGKDTKLRRWNSHDGSLYATQFDHGCSRTPLPYQMDVLRSGNSSANDVFLCPGEHNSVVMYPLHGGAADSEGTALNVLQGHVNPVRTAVFRDNGMFQVISGSSDGMMLVWDCASLKREHLDVLRAEDEEAERISREKHAQDKLGMSLITQRAGLSTMADLSRRKNPLVDDYWSDEEDDAASQRKRRFGAAAATLLIEHGGLLRSRFSETEAGDSAPNVASSSNAQPSSRAQAQVHVPSDEQETSAILDALDNLPSFLGPTTAAAPAGTVANSVQPGQLTAKTAAHRTLMIGSKRYRIRLRTRQGGADGTGAADEEELLNPAHPVVRPLTDSQMFDRINNIQKRRKFEKTNAIALMKAQMFPDKYK